MVLMPDNDSAHLVPHLQVVFWSLPVRSPVLYTFEKC